MDTSTRSVPPGSLDGMVLKALSWGPMHGHAVARWLRDVTDEALDLEEGTLYPALYRMEDRGWIDAEWRASEHNRRAKYYRLTAKGRRQLAKETATWLGLAAMVTRVFTSARQPA